MSVGIGDIGRIAAGRSEAGVGESIALHDLTSCDGECLGETWRGGYVSVKLTVFPAGVDMGRQGIEQSMIETAASQVCGQPAQIDAAQMGLQAAVDHFPGQRAGGAAPEWEQWLKSASLQHAFTVGAYIFEKQIAKREMRDLVIV